MPVFKIPTKNIYWLKGKIEKLVNKANKLHVSPLKYEISEPYIINIDEDLLPKGTEVVDFKIEGESPNIEGWTFIASLDFDISNSSPIVRKLIGCNDDISAYYNVESKCEHCNINRFRKKTYIVKNLESGEFKQIGSTCIKDFTSGHLTPEQLANYSKIIDQILLSLQNETKNEDSVFSSRYMNLHEVLSHTSCIIRKYGWTSVTEARNSEDETVFSTAGRVSRSFWNKKSDEYKEVKYSLSEIDKENATGAIEWAKNLKDINDYCHNISTLAKSEYFKDDRNFSLVCSIMGSYIKEIIKKLPIKKIDTVDIKNEFFGEINTRYKNIKLKCIFSKYLDSSVLFKFIDEEGHVFIWFSTSVNEINKNEWFISDFSVKKHNVYEDKKQTLINRVKIKN